MNRKSFSEKIKIQSKDLPRKAIPTGKTSKDRCKEGGPLSELISD
jgi:hypothetical protein